MLQEKLIKRGLDYFNFTETAWYQAIMQKQKRYTLRLLCVAFSMAAFIPMVQAVTDFSRGKTTYLPNYIISFAIYIGCLVMLLVRRNTAFMTLVALTISTVGFWLSLVLPIGRDINRVVMYLYPLLAFQLVGSKRGALWCLVTFAGSAALYFLHSAGFLATWTLPTASFSVVLGITTLTTIIIMTISVERRHESLLERLAELLIFDEVTSLPNRDALIHAIRPGYNYIFAIIKIENFSDLVALFGYDFSDVISGFASAQLVKNEERFHYRTYQLKYNEYGILMDTGRLLTVCQTEQYLYEIVKTLEIETLPWESDKISVLYRLGAAIIADGETEAPLSRADVALKKAERSHAVLSVYDDSNAEQRTARDAVTKFTQLIRNREDHTFKAVFQPIFNTDGTRIEWYEALLRIMDQSGEYTTIYPYLTVARSTGFYHYLTDFMLEKTADAILKYDVDISVNISVSDILRPDFIALVDKAYEKIKNRQGRIIFEIIESDELVELDKCILFIDYISRFGFKIAIDDFGSGYSNYTNLVNLPVDIVKIDGALIKKMRHDDNARTLVEGIIHFCRKSNKKTVAEFVEDEHIFDTVKALEIDFLQGYYLGKPGQMDDCASCLLDQLP